MPRPRALQRNSGTFHVNAPADADIPPNGPGYTSAAPPASTGLGPEARAPRLVAGKLAAVAISSGPEFEAALDTAVALWRRRAELLSEAERVSGGDDVLGEVEDEYRGRIAALAPRAEQHLPELEARLARKPGVQRASPACRWRSATNDAASRGFADVRNHDR